MMWKIMTNNSSSVAAQQALDNAVKQTTASLKAQTLEMQKAALAMRDYNKAAGLAGTTGKAEAVSLKASNAERGKSVQLLGKETQARQSSLAEQTIADMERALALSGKTPRRTRWCTKPRAASSRARTRAPRTC